MPAVRALADRAIALDDDLEQGRAARDVHLARQPAARRSADRRKRARTHFKRAVELAERTRRRAPTSRSRSASPSPAQDRAEFESLLKTGARRRSRKGSVDAARHARPAAARARAARSHRYAVHEMRPHERSHVTASKRLSDRLRRRSLAGVPLLRRAGPTSSWRRSSPAATTWHKALLDMGNTWKTDTAGRVTLTVYPGRPAAGRNDDHHEDAARLQTAGRVPDRTSASPESTRRSTSSRCRSSSRSPTRKRRSRRS